jgi:hypothetical protein
MRPTTLKCVLVGLSEGVNNAVAMICPRVITSFSDPSRFLDQFRTRSGAMTCFTVIVFVAA